MEVKDLEQNIVDGFISELKNVYFKEYIFTYRKNESKQKWMISLYREDSHRKNNLFSLHFENTNKIITFRVENENRDSIYIFLHIYSFLISYLRNNRKDYFVKNNNFLIMNYVYEKNPLLMDYTTEKTKSIYQLLKYAKESIYGSSVVFWKTNNITMITEYMPHHFWDFKSNTETDEGFITIDDINLSSKEEIDVFLSEVKRNISSIKKLEWEALKYINQFDKKAYYENQVKSICIFEKMVNFRIEFYNEDEKKKWYVLHFKDFVKNFEDLKELFEVLICEIDKHIKKDRLRAITENRH